MFLPWRIKDHESPGAGAEDFPTLGAGCLGGVVPTVNLTRTDAGGQALLQLPVFLQYFSEAVEIAAPQLIGQVKGELYHPALRRLCRGIADNSVGLRLQDSGGTARNAGIKD